MPVCLAIKEQFCGRLRNYLNDDKTAKTPVVISVVSTGGVRNITEQPIFND